MRKGVESREEALPCPALCGHRTGWVAGPPYEKSKGETPPSRMIQAPFKEKQSDLFSEGFEKWEFALCRFPWMTSKRYRLAGREERGPSGSGTQNGKPRSHTSEPCHLHEPRL